MNQITDNTIDEFHNVLWNEAKLKYGDAIKVPLEELSHIGELTRGLYVLQVWQRDGSSGSPARFMSGYSVTSSVVEQLVERYCGKQYVAEIRESKPERRIDKWRALEVWAKSNFLAETSTEDVVSLSGFSHSTVLNYLKTSPYFRKIARGTWEVRDPKADREREKNG